MFGCLLNISLVLKLLQKLFTDIRKLSRKKRFSSQPFKCNEGSLQNWSPVIHAWSLPSMWKKLWSSAEAPWKGKDALKNNFNVVCMHFCFLLILVRMVLPWYTFFINSSFVRLQNVSAISTCRGFLALASWYVRILEYPLRVSSWFPNKV